MQDINRPFPHGTPAPENAIALNDDFDYETLSRWAKQFSALIKEPKGTTPISPAVIYGRHFKSYLAIQHLLACGVPGSYIVFVRPPALATGVSSSDSDSKFDSFNEPVVKATVLRALKDAEVVIIDNHVLASWRTAGSSVGKLDHLLCLLVGRFDGLLVHFLAGWLVGWLLCLVAPGFGCC